MYTKVLTNSKSAVPAPTSAFLSELPGAPGALRYAVLSSAVRVPSLRGPAAGLGLANSGLVCLFNVDGTISGGKCKYVLKYSIPSFVRYL